MRPLLIAVVVLLTACSPATETSPDRLVILRDGDVVTLDRDGSEPTTIASNPSGSFFQPVWSPDRNLLAFGSIGAESAVAIARLSDGEVYTADTDSFPFYFSWSARNELGLLRNGDEGLNLETVSLGEAGLSSPSVVAKGQPLYYSWSRDGNELVAHIGPDTLTFSDGEEVDPLPVTPGEFAAPAWTERGIYAVVGESDQQSLVRIDRDGTIAPLALVGRTTNLVPNSDGSLVAIQTLAPQEQFQSASFQPNPRVPANRLVVLDATTGDTTAVTNDVVLAFFWSPADDTLLVLDVVNGAQARWSVWTDGDRSELARFDFEESFLTQFVPFFDQYAQSVSLWSPSGDAIAFPGRVDGRTGIWVQEIGGDPIWISEGSWVSWAP